MASWADYLSLLGGNPSAANGQGGILGPYGPGGVLGPVDVSSLQAPQLGPVAGAGGASPAPGSSPADNGNFWSTKNPDGTTSVLGGLFNYDPTKDIGRGDRLGLFGAAFADAGAQLGGHPDAATNLTRYTEARRLQAGRTALSQALTGFGGQAPQGNQPMPNAAPQNSGAPLSTSWNADNPGPTSGPITVPPGSAHPAAAPAQGPITLPPAPPGSNTPAPSAASLSFSLRNILPRLAPLAAQGVDISPIVSLLKDAQPKYNPTVNYTKDGKAYLVGDDGSIDWLDGVTPRDKTEIAGNGVAYNPYATAPGTDFSDRDKPFNTATGAPNKPVQQYELNKTVAGATAAARIEANKPQFVPFGAPGYMQNGKYTALPSSETGGGPGAGTGDAKSPSITGQLGMSMAAYNLLTGNTAAVGRGRPMQMASQELDQVISQRGLDPSIVKPKVQAFSNAVQMNTLKSNTMDTQAREIAGTVANLAPVADKLGGGNLRWVNGAAQFVGGLSNDPNAQQYALYLNQLRADLAGFNAVSGGKIGLHGQVQTDNADYATAEKVIKNGLDRGGAQGLAAAVEATRQKNVAVVEKQTEQATRGIWTALGVGQNYDATHGQTASPPSARPLPTPGALPRLAPPSGTSGGVKWRIVPDGGR